jgi:WNK lysine deficient protein kinase
MFDDASSQCSSHGTYSDLNFSSADDQYHNMASTRNDKHPIMSHKCTRFSHGEDQLTLNRCKILAKPQEPSTSECERMIENRILTRNKSLIDMRSQLLHRSLVEKVNKRRLFKTVGAVEDIGYQTPYKITSKKSPPVCSNFDISSSRSDKEVNLTSKKI